MVTRPTLKVVVNRLVGIVSMVAADNPLKMPVDGSSIGSLSETWQVFVGHGHSRSA